MNSPHRTIVHAALALHLGIEVDQIHDDQRLGADLDLDAFDLTLVGLRIEERHPDRGELPIELFDPSMCVRELCAVVEAWCAPGGVEDEAPDTVRSSRPPAPVHGSASAGSFPASTIESSPSTTNCSAHTSSG